MSRFSIIIPYQESHCFEDTLASALRYRPDVAEVIVVHDGSFFDLHDLSTEIKSVAVRDSDLETNQHVALLTEALSACSGKFAVWMRPGVELDEGWVESVEQAFADPNVASATPLVISRAQPESVVSCGVSTDRSGTRKFVGSQSSTTDFSLKKTCESLGPTSWLAAWRVGILKSVMPLVSSTSDFYMDVEIASLLRRTGYRTSVQQEFVGFTENEDLILAELKTPHGTCAQRGYEKRLMRFDQIGMAGNVIVDLLRSPLELWRFKHALQRLSAAQWRVQDAVQLDLVLHTSDGIAQTVSESREQITSKAA